MSYKWALGSGDITFSVGSFQKVISYILLSFFSSTPKGLFAAASVSILKMKDTQIKPQHPKSN